jgi:hypothetical protein
VNHFGGNPPGAVPDDDSHDHDQNHQAPQIAARNPSGALCRRHDFLHRPLDIFRALASPRAVGF